VCPGGYAIGDPSASLAVCTLSDAELAEKAAALPGAAIAGRLHTANLGTERIITNVTANPGVRFLLLCGRDSQLSQPGDALLALAANGTDTQRAIRGTAGYMPRLASVSPAAVESFRRQVEVADHRGETSLDKLRALVADLAGRGLWPVHRPRGRRRADQAAQDGGSTEIRPGGRRRDPLGYDPADYFVISLDQQDAKIMAEHYRTDHAPAHRMRGTSAEGMLAGLLREGLSPNPATPAGDANSPAAAAMRPAFSWVASRRSCRFPLVRRHRTRKPLTEL
jgi:tetrahydromethanopterin S-methyltransferase subunit A